VNASLSLSTESALFDWFLVIFAVVAFFPFANQRIAIKIGLCWVGDKNEIHDLRRFSVEYSGKSTLTNGLWSWQLIWEDKTK